MTGHLIIFFFFFSKQKTSIEDSTDSSEVKTTTERYQISRYELGRILGRNFRGLKRLAQIEFQDAFNVCINILIIVKFKKWYLFMFLGNKIQFGRIPRRGQQTICQQFGSGEKETIEGTGERLNSYILLQSLNLVFLEYRINSHNS